MTDSASITAAESRRYFGKYAVLGLLGQGGMARVYLAVSSGPRGVNKLLVVKELRRELASEPAAQSMFLDEARIATRLNHPNVVQTHEVVDDPSAMYLTMEYLEGQPLQSLLPHSKRDALSRLLLLRVLADTLAALHYVHELRDYDGSELGLVHRDVSPHNIFVTYDGLVKLVDFGVAKAADASTNTATGMFKGKVRYASPEQALGVHVDRRSDIYSLGVVLWELAAGRRMWSDAVDNAILVKLANGEIPRLRAVVPDIHPDLEAICEKALRRDPDERYETAEAFRADVLSFMESQSTRGLLPDLGRWMSETFAKERAAARQFVDARMQVLRSTPRFEAPRVPSTPETVEVTSGTALATVQEAEPSAAKRRPARGRWGIALGAVALVAGIAAFALRPKSVAAPPVAAAPAIAAPVAPAPAPPLESRLNVRAEPIGAQLLLDGVALGAAPYDGVQPRDGREHVLTLSASGYVDREVRVRFDRDVDLTLDLKPAATAPAPTAAAPPAVTAASRAARPAAQDAPPAKTPPRRTIYEDNPYQR